MNIIQTFYDNLASHYDKLFLDWKATTCEQADLLDRIFHENGFSEASKVLDCACGIGTQSIGLARLGYDVTASDISEAEICEAKKRADENKADIRFEIADFRKLSEKFSEQFDIVIAMDNALPHMLSSDDLKKAVDSIVGRVKDGGIFVCSIRDYDAILKNKPPYLPPYIHNTESGKRVSFQTWDWNGDCYRLTQYIIEDEKTLTVNKFECEYRATLRNELTELLTLAGCNKVSWLFPEKSGFYQPIVVARKGE